MEDSSGFVIDPATSRIGMDTGSHPAYKQKNQAKALDLPAVIAPMA
jgi:hypothetical protein